MNDILEILRANSLLRTVGHDTLNAILPQLERVELRDCATLFRKGDAGDSYYVIESGSIKISTDEIELNNLTVGDGFGEMSLLGGHPRSATAFADPDATLIRISRAGFVQLIEAQPDLIEQFHATTQSMMRHSLLSATFGHLVGETESVVLKEIEAELVWETYAPGQIILEQGAAGNDLLLIASGRVRATFHNGEHDRVLGEIGSGGIVGELSLLSERPRSATVTAIRETTVIRIHQENFKKIMLAHPDFALRLMKIIIDRQQHNFDQYYVEKPVKLHFGLIPTHEMVDTLKFAETLLPHLEKYGKVLILNRTRFDELYGVKDVSHYLELDTVSQIIQLWLNELEHHYDYVLYIADPDWTPWTKWVANKIDRVLLVGEAQHGAEIGQLESAVNEHIQRLCYELVIVHEESTKQPTNTAAWLNIRQIHRHHHVRRGDEAHLARVARLLTGNGIGLVFSGGGARGYAHLGVIKALMESQVPIDAIGAVSMGAVIGGGLLVHMDYPSLVSRASQIGSRKALLDFTFPVSALMRSKKVSDALYKVYGDFQIEDGWLSFFCISTNLTKAQINVHRQGKLHEAVRASLSIPGVFSPVIRDGDVTIDGGVLNNYPVDIMREFLEGGTVIGTLAAGREGQSRPYKIDDYLNGWRLFISGMIPGIKRKRVPSILKTIMSASSIKSTQLLREAQQRTDLLLQTDPYPIGALDFDKHEELAKKGYETNIEIIQQWAKDHASLIDEPELWPPVTIASPQ